MIVQRGEFANYLRKNSGVKGDATSSEIQLLQSDFSPFECSVVLLHQSLLDGWCGHNEVLVPTLLNHNGFAIADMGGKGRFRPSDLRENFYTESEANSIGLLDSGTMKYRPSFVAVGREKNKLYHPVKPYLPHSVKKSVVSVTGGCRVLWSRC